MESVSSVCDNAGFQGKMATMGESTLSNDVVSVGVGAHPTSVYQNFNLKSAPVFDDFVNNGTDVG